MLFERTRSIHTFGMRFDIAVVVLDGYLRVLEVLRVHPGRLVRPRLRARHLLEAPAGANLLPGDALRSDSCRRGERGRGRAQDVFREGRERPEA
jgi:hypothetical protein